MTPDTVSAWELMTPTEHAFYYAIFVLLGFIYLFCLYKIMFCPTEQDKKQLQEYMRKKKLEQAYKRRYLYWYEKSHEVITGCAAQAASKRDAYARKHAQEDLDKYNFI